MSKSKKTPRASNNYVDNAKFLEAIKEYRKIALPLPPEERPVLTNYIGECIFKIADNWTMKSQYRGYSYREDMVMYAIEDCLKYFMNFDPEKSAYPFSYFTQIVKYACWRYIEDQHEDYYTKLMALQHVNMMNMSVVHSDNSASDGVDLDVHMSDGAEDTANDFIANFERRREEKLKKSRDRREANRPTTPLSKFVMKGD